MLKSGGKMEEGEKVKILRTKRKKVGEYEKIVRQEKNFRWQM